MKKHYIQPWHGGIKCGVRVVDKDNDTTNDYRKVNCVRCISAMSPGEQLWHDNNNNAWIVHKHRDGRRKHV